MRRLIILFLLCISPAIFAGNNIFNENFTQPDTVKLPYLQAAYKSQIPNAFIFFFNRVISKNEFAYINAHTIKSNFKHRPMWDYDLFGKNLMAHPFHGSLDYVGARINGDRKSVV